MKPLSIKPSLVFLSAFLLAGIFSACKKNEPNSKSTDTTKNVTPPVVGQVSTVAGVAQNPLIGAFSPYTLTIDPSGNIYTCTLDGRVIYKLDANYNLTLFAGDQTGYHYAEGTGAAAEFASIVNLVTDSKGNVFVNDEGNFRIRKITPDAVVTTFAGSGSRAVVDGTGTAASFANVGAMTIDKNDNLYVWDNRNLREITAAGVVTTIYKNLPNNSSQYSLVAGPAGDIYMAGAQENKIYKITQSGAISVFAGSGTAGSADGTGVLASLNSPKYMTIDADGNIYVSDYGSQLIRKITPAGVVTTVGGNVNGSKPFKNIQGVTVDAAGNIYIADAGDFSIKKMSSAGIMTTVMGVAPLKNGAAATATFREPTGLTVDANENIYVADAGNNMIRKISNNGTVTTFAGSGTAALTDGPGASSAFNYPSSIAMDASGNFYVTDYLNNRIRKISPDGTVSTISLSANTPYGIAVAKNGNIYFNDTQNNTVYQVINNVASSYSQGTAEGVFNIPDGLAIDAGGTLYVADTEGERICKVAAGGGTGTTIAGAYSSPPATGSTDAVGSQALFYNPYGITVDADGNIYVADTNNNLIRKITPDSKVTTIAGSLTAGSANGIGTAATFRSPHGIAINASGTALYVADTGNGLIRKIILK